ncbi:hypothetical protein DIPPA_09667 [Diplonema papillatum]|nr:hypothetical protein DIPPA_09667 [Diplonema papillatum]
MTSSNDASKEAYQRFLAKNYDQCSASLHTLLSSTPRGDPKIQHNVAICEYFKGGCQDAGKFLADLDKLGKSIERDRRIEHVNSLVAIEAFAARNQQSRPLCLEFEGHEYVRFNEAVVHFHLRQYTEAIDRLIPMYYNEVHITQLLHVRVVLLLLSCLLAQYNKKDLHMVERVRQLVKKLDDCQPFISFNDAEEACPTHKGPVLRIGAHALLLRAQYEAVQGGSQQAVDLLQQYRNSSDSTGWWPVVVHFNNLGMFHMSINKPHLASLYLTKAIETYETNRPKSEGTQPSNGMGHYPSMASVHYNNGICHMIRGQYELAFKSFAVATPLLKDTPTLWLRMAQCCIRQWELNLAKEQTRAFEEKQQVPTPSSLSIPPRQVIYLPTADVLLPKSIKAEPGDDMSLVFADKCLRNAHYLMLRRFRGRKSKHHGNGAKEENGDEEGNDKEDDGEGRDEGDGQLEESELHAESADDPEVAAVLQAVYCNMAYTALCLSNPSVALAAGEKLLSLPSLFKENHITCLSYCVEAYCRLGRASEALELLNKANLQDLLASDAPSCLTLPCGAGIQSSHHTSSSSAERPAFGSSPIHIGSTAEERDSLSTRHTAALFTNLCIVHIMQGKFGRAQQCLDQFKGEDQPAADLLQIYLHLAAGNKADAIAEVTNRPLVPPFTVQP